MSSFIINVPEMFSFTRMIVSVSAALALVSVDSVLAAPTNLEARASAVPSPAFVIYTDKFVSADVLPPVDKVKVRTVHLLYSHF